MKVIYSGLESAGKSLKMAMEADRILDRNIYWKRKYGFTRQIVSNMHFTGKFMERAQKNGIPIVYWQDLDELVLLEGCDVFIDEVGNYFDARGWEGLSLDIRRWLTQGAKNGIEIYGSAQDFAQVDKSFRRLTNKLYYVSKLVGSRRPAKFKPPRSGVWGMCLVHKLDPQAYDEEEFRPLSVFPSFFLIRRKFTDIFDTNQKIVRSKPPYLKKIVRVCLEDGHKITKYV